MASSAPVVPLNNGIPMPAIGLGTWRAAPGEETKRAVRWALETGCRLIDTASMYGNEASVGKAIRESEVPREHVFVTTKVWNSDQGYEKTLRAFDESRERLSLEVVDLYLIHWPEAGLRLDTWRALEELYDRGRCRAIGVSNYMVPHLEETLEHGSVVPAVNQIELHPYNYGQRKGVVEFCRSKGIQVEAYSPLTKGRKLGEDRLAAIARHYGKTPAQVLLRWGMQSGFVVIPKSTNRDRIREDFAIFDFELAEEDMSRLNGLNEDLATSWDPTWVA